MTIYTEADQVELLKKWWQEYGTAIIIGIILAIALGYGWRAWQQHHEKTLEHASMRYEQLLTNIVNGNSSAAETEADRLMDRYRHTPYAELAGLQLARQEIYRGDFSSAERNLRWVMKRGDTPALRQLSRLRVARLLLYQKRFDEALVLLEDVDDKSYMPAIDEVRGDVLVAKGDQVGARQAYQAAASNKIIPDLIVMQPLLQMKLDDLAGATQ
jgi:predicted negative regulator of RcsB-dependent stress response